MNDEIRDGCFPLSLVTDRAARFEVRLVGFEDWCVARIGDGAAAGDTAAPRLRDLLSAAADRDGRPSDHGRAWALLMRTDFATFGLDALQHLAERPGYNAVLLEPLLCRLAVEQPAAIARLFPHGLGVEACALCGEHGLRAAIRELGSGRTQNRLDAAGVLLVLAEGGLLDVPAEPLVEALVAEGNEDVANQMKAALRAVRRQRRLSAGMAAAACDGGA